MNMNKNNLTEADLLNLLMFIQCLNISVGSDTAILFQQILLREVVKKLDWQHLVNICTLSSVKFPTDLKHLTTHAW